MPNTRILIVEDEALIAEALRDKLEELGHTVIDVVDTAEDAIATAQRERPGLVLMDIRLRGDADGIDAATMIGESTDVPVVFMTAHSDAETVARAMLSQPYGYVVKPVRDSDLVTAIKTALLRHAAEERLRACEAQSRAIYENTGDLILQLFHDSRVLGANPACRAALGYSPSQLCRLSFGDLVAETERGAVSEAFGRTANGSEDIRVGFALVGKDGRVVSVRGVMGRRLVAGRVDRVWAVLRPVVAPTDTSTASGEV